MNKKGTNLKLNILLNYTKWNKNKNNKSINRKDINHKNKLTKKENKDNGGKFMLSLKGLYSKPSLKKSSNKSGSKSKIV